MVVWYGWIVGMLQRVVYPQVVKHEEATTEQIPMMTTLHRLESKSALNDSDDSTAMSSDVNMTPLCELQFDMTPEVLADNLAILERRLDSTLDTLERQMSDDSLGNSLNDSLSNSLSNSLTGGTDDTSSSTSNSASGSSDTSPNLCRLTEVQRRLGRSSWNIDQLQPQLSSSDSEGGIDTPNRILTMEDGTPLYIPEQSILCSLSE